jgi:hypothetical protein
MRRIVQWAARVAVAGFMLIAALPIFLIPIEFAMSGDWLRLIGYAVMLIFVVCMVLAAVGATDTSIEGDNDEHP